MSYIFIKVFEDNWVSFLKKSYNYYNDSYGNKATAKLIVDYGFGIDVNNTTSLKQKIEDYLIMGTYSFFDEHELMEAAYNLKISHSLNNNIICDKIYEYLILRDIIL
jgi:hypothetical protein